MKVKEGSFVLVQLDKREQLESLVGMVDCYTRPDSFDDLIIDGALIDGNEKLKSYLGELVSRDTEDFGKIMTNAYVLFWV